MFEIDISLNKNIYQQIVDNTKDLITKGILKESDKMPSVREMASLLKVNISTVQKAYQILEKEKIIETMIGRGTFVTSNLDNIVINYDRLDNLLLDLVREAKILGMSKVALLEKVDNSFGTSRWKLMTKNNY